MHLRLCAFCTAHSGLCTVNTEDCVQRIVNSVRETSSAQLRIFQLRIFSAQLDSVQFCVHFCAHRKPNKASPQLQRADQPKHSSTSGRSLARRQIVSCRQLCPTCGRSCSFRAGLVAKWRPLSSVVSRQEPKEEDQLRGGKHNGQSVGLKRRIKTNCFSAK